MFSERPAILREITNCHVSKSELFYHYPYVDYCTNGLVRNMDNEQRKSEYRLWTLQRRVESLLLNLRTRIDDRFRIIKKIKWGLL